MNLRLSNCLSAMRTAASSCLIALLASVASMALVAAPAWAQAKFALTGYKVLGNNLLDPQTIERATRPHTGPQSDFETIQRAVEALESAFAAAGFGAVKIEVPEQELESGIVTLQVIEGKLGRITVDANPHFDQDNILRSLPSLQVGSPVNTKSLDRNLQLANDGGTKFANVTFKRSANDRDMDANVKLVAEDPQRWLVLLDNTGSPSTGLYRLGVVYQHGNVFNRDHALSIQLMSSPGYWSQVGIVALGYRVPMYHWGGALDFSVSHSNVDSGQVVQAGGGPDLAISGSGTTMGVRYSHALESTPELSHKLSLGLENRAYDNSVKPTTSATATEAASLVPSLATRPLILGYSGSWRNAERDFFFNASWLHNLPGATNGSTADFNQPGGRAGANAAFNTFKFGVQHTERFASLWSLRTALSGQFTGDQLISAEQFGAGGSDSVRGFTEREIAADTGFRAGLELWSAPFDISQWRLVPLAFLDAATVRRNNPAASETAEQSIASAGLGLRASFGRTLSLRLDWGHALRGVASSAGTQKGDQKMHASVVWVLQ